MPPIRHRRVLRLAWDPRSSIELGTREHDITRPRAWLPFTPRSVAISCTTPAERALLTRLKSESEK